MTGFPSPADDARALAAVHRRRTAAATAVSLLVVRRRLGPVTIATERLSEAARAGTVGILGFAREVVDGLQETLLEREVEKLWRDA